MPDRPATASSHAGQYQSRLFDYHKHLPYAVEDAGVLMRQFDDLVGELHSLLEARDWNGARLVLKNLRTLGQLKVSFPKDIRKAIILNLYEIIVHVPDSRDARSFLHHMAYFVCNKNGLYIMPSELVIDWRPAFERLNCMITSPFAPAFASSWNEWKDVLVGLVKIVRVYFEPRDRKEILESSLQLFDLANPYASSNGAFKCFSLLCLFFPTCSPEDGSEPAQKYLPAVFQIWSYVTNFMAVDLLMLDLLSRLARDSLPDRGSSTTYGAFGIFTPEQGRKIVASATRAFEIPVTGHYRPDTEIASNHLLGLSASELENELTVDDIYARIITYSLGPDPTIDDFENFCSHLTRFLVGVRINLHPTNSTKATKSLAAFLCNLAGHLTMRWNLEQSGEIRVPPNRCLSRHTVTELVKVLRDSAFICIYDSSPAIYANAAECLGYIAYLDPLLVVPGALKRIYPAMQGLLETRRTIAAMELLKSLVRSIVSHEQFRPHVAALLELCLPGVDANDVGKTYSSLEFIQTVFQLIPFHDLSGNLPPGIAAQWIQEQIEIFEDTPSDDMLLSAPNGRGDQSMDIEADSASDSSFSLTDIAMESTAGFHNFLIACLQRLFSFFENTSEGSDQMTSVYVRGTFLYMFSAVSGDLRKAAVETCVKFIRDASWSALPYITIMTSCLMIHKDLFLPEMFPQVLSAIEEEIIENNAGSDRLSTSKDVLPRDRHLIFNLKLLKNMALGAGESLLLYENELSRILILMQERLKGYAGILANEILSNALVSLTEYYSLERGTIEKVDNLEPEEYLSLWGRSCDLSSLKLSWHVPSTEELRFAVDLFAQSVNLSVGTIDDIRLQMRSPGFKLSRNMGSDIILSLKKVSSAMHGLSKLLVPSSSTESGVGTSLEECKLDERYLGYVLYRFNISAGYDPSDKFLQACSERIRPIMMTVGRCLIDTYAELKADHQDEVQCFEALVACISSFVLIPNSSVSTNPLADSDFYENDVDHFQIPGLRRNYPRSTMVVRALKYHADRLEKSTFLRPMSTMDFEMFKILVECSFSFYSTTRCESQVGLVNCVKRFNKALSSICQLMLLDVDSKEKHILAGVLHLFDASPFLMKAAGRSWKLRSNIFKKIMAGLGHDGSSLKQFSYQIFAKLTTRPVFRVRWTAYKGRYLNLLHETNHEQTVSTLKEELKLFDSMNQIEAEKFTTEVVNTVEAQHWRVVVIMLSFSVSTFSITESAPDSRLLKILAEYTVDNHSAIRSLSIAMLATLLPLLWVSTEVTHLGDISFGKYLENGQTSISTKEVFPSLEKYEARAWFSDRGRTKFIDSYSNGWLSFRDNTITSNAQLGSDETTQLCNPGIRDNLYVLGQVFNREWLKSLVAFLSEEPRSAESGAAIRVRFQVVNFLRGVWKLQEYNDQSVSLEDAAQELVALCVTSTEKYHHRAAVELLCSIFSAHQHCSQEERDRMHDLIVPIIRSALESSLNVDNLSYWKTFVRHVFTGNDYAKHWPLYNILSKFNLDLDSDHAFSESTKLALHRKLISACSWHFTMDDAGVSFLIDKSDNPYKKLRSEIGYNICEMLSVYNLPPYKTVHEFVSASENLDYIGAERYIIPQEFHNLLDKFRQKIQDCRKAKNQDSEAYTRYTSVCKTFLSFVQLATSGFDSSVVYGAISRWFLSEVLYMLDVKDDPDLRLQAAGQMFRLANSQLMHDTFMSLLVTVEDLAQKGTHWHHKIHVVPVIIRLAWGHACYLRGELRDRLFQTMMTLLFDSQLEVRSAASDGMTALLHCSVLDKDELVNRYIEIFKNELSSTSLTMNDGSTDSLQSGSSSLESTRRHGAVLGLASILASCPYETPPEWMPRVVALLSSCSHEPHPIRKTVRQELEKFRKLRSDTWHLDQKAFSSEQLDDLAGMSSHNYFI